MSIRKAIEELIICKAVDRGMLLTNAELKDAANGVEYWFNETVYDSIDTALNDVEYDREKEEPFITVKFYMMGDNSGYLYTRDFSNENEYDYWYAHMKDSIEIFEEY